ncbi:hypothetical protein [Companilactobacillus sp.]|uniref:hypothetical protein n=1 Tax=Companilactobacillus sp. TaxID=2767905 RepID=UPI0026307713|nr:hypothetical protein [Companilactobacillus sp.]
MDKKQALEIIYDLERKYKGGIMGIPNDHPLLKKTQAWYQDKQQNYVAKNRYDWKSIQADFDKGLRKSDIADNNGLSLSSLRNGINQGLVDDTKWKRITNARLARLETMHKQERKRVKAREQFYKYNWSEVQKQLDKGTPKTEICRIFSILTGVLKTAVEDGLISDLRWKKVSKRVNARKSYHKLRRKGEA